MIKFVAVSSVTSKKRKCAVLSIEQELEICEYVKAGWSCARISSDYGSGKSTISDIVKTEDKLRTFQGQLQSEDSKTSELRTNQNYKRGPVPTCPDN